MPEPLKICFAASEVAPFTKTGGLADVAGALPVELHRRGHDIRLFSPLHSNLSSRPAELLPVEFIQDVPVEIGSRSYRFSARTALLPETDLPLYFIDCPELFHRDALYGGDEDDATRFALLCRAIVECCQRMAWAPDILHCNDWHTALVPLLLRTIYDWDSLFATTRTLFTIHNIGYQGVFPSRILEHLGLNRWSHLFDQEDLAGGRVNFLRTGLIYADAISTVSPTYAQEIQSADYGMGLDSLLRARSDSLVGILNGVDYDQWSPETDPFLSHRYSADDLGGKSENKRELLASLDLEPAPGVPVLGIVSRLAHQKGFDLCFDVLPETLMSRDLRILILGSGEARYEEFFASLQQRFPDRVCYHRGYHEELAHMIEAASDLFLMPSRYEPCGLNQLFSMRYGTLPVVRRTGGLADTVEHADASGGGTGFVFEHFTEDGLRWALNLALDTYDDRDRWSRLMHNAMQKNFSWETRVEPYVELYSRIRRR